MCFHLFVKNRSELVDYVSHCVVIVWDTRMVVELRPASDCLQQCSIKC